jgi:hypothetical protein
MLGILLIILSGDFVEIAGVLIIKVSNLGVVLIIALCKVGETLHWQQGRVGVGNASHGGVEVCALSVLSLSIENINLGFVFSNATDVTLVSKRWGLIVQCVISDYSIGDVFMLKLDCCVVRTELIISLSSI